MYYLLIRINIGSELLILILGYHVKNYRPMANNNRTEVSALHSKKEMKKAIADKLQTALPEMQSTLGEKQFSRRLKKAVKMLLHGIHSDDVLKKAKKKAVANKAASAKKLAVKEAKAVKKTKKAKAAMPEMF
jgi:hypothetical protein